MEVRAGHCLLCGGRVGPMCGRCRSRLDPPPTTRVRGVGPVPALCAYAGTGALLIQVLKFRDGRRLVPVLADELAALARPDVDAVAWVPTSGPRRRGRGFDQAELLGRALARRMGVRGLGMLRRVSHGTQTGRSRAERAASVRFRCASAPNPGRVLLVDDVCTTGATLHAARLVLDAAGWSVAGSVVVARTP